MGRWEGQCRRKDRRREGKEQTGHVDIHTKVLLIFEFPNEGKYGKGWNGGIQNTPVCMLLKIT